MDIRLRELQHCDTPFLREMLYEGMFWRTIAGRPTLEEALALPEVVREVAGWGERDGDTAVVAMVDSTAVGAAWYRFWTEDDSSSEYVDENTPVLAIAVHRDYRNRGIGRRMIAWLIDRASKQSISQISLSVSKDNRALKLYRDLGFREHFDRGDAFTMVCRT
ncbi:GNAT family N-acetyltransferase [Candidatus Bipolaricaulota bacterium]|nr:GNAT family N-acetyltransferase [Candidatus Bipolaricaulota bacterium]